MFISLSQIALARERVEALIFRITVTDKFAINKIGARVVDIRFQSFLARHDFVSFRFVSRETRKPDYAGSINQLRSIMLMTTFNRGDKRRG